MTGAAELERRYRRLLAWYPEPFRSEHEDEMLAVLMAGARPGQRRPGLMDSADVIWSALGMRLRAVRSGPAYRELADAMAVFSLVAPLFLLVVTLLEVALPYRPRVDPRFPALPEFLGRVPQIGGLPLLGQHGFRVAVGGQVIIAALVLLGLRRTALIAMAAAVGYWIVARYWLPEPLQFLLLMAAVLYPYALQLIPVTSSSSNLIGSPTPAHLALLSLPPLLVACWAVLTALPPRFPVAQTSPE